MITASASSKNRLLITARLFITAIIAKLVAFSSILFFTVNNNQALAHPHAWNDIQVEVINKYPRDLNISAATYGDPLKFDRVNAMVNKTPIYGFIFTLQMDQVTSAPVIIDLRKNRLKELSQEIASNLLHASFFTKVWLQEQQPVLDDKGKEIKGKYKINETPLKFANTISMIDIKELPNQKSLIKYVAWFPKPIELRPNQQLKLQTYDLSYWIDMKYRKPLTDVVFSQLKTPTVCDFIIEDASPRQSLVDYATSLGPNENPNDPDFGKHFAQTLYIGCPISK